MFSVHIKKLTASLRYRREIVEDNFTLRREVARWKAKAEAEKRNVDILEFRVSVIPTVLRSIDMVNAKPFIRGQYAGLETAYSIMNGEMERRAGVDLCA